SYSVNLEELGPVLAVERARRRFEFCGAQVVGRRVDEIAGKAHALDDAREILAVDVARQLELDVPLVLPAVADEAVGAERESERREPRIVRRGGEAIGARRQQPRQRARPKQVLACPGGVLGREGGAGWAAAGAGGGAGAARLRPEPRGVGEASRARIEPAAQLPPVRRVNEGYRNRRDRVAAGKK